MATVRYTTINGEVIAEKRGGVRSLYVPDPLGSTVALLDTNQTQTDTFSYWPYGEVRTRTGTTATPFQFIGTAGYYRDNSSRAYVRARYLDTAKIRWMTRDPAGLVGVETNLYLYVGNGPQNTKDPSGLESNKDDPTKYKCPPGYKAVYITGYGRGTGDVNPPGEPSRPAQKYDCAVGIPPNADAVCPQGSHVHIRDRTNEGGDGKPIELCFVCDTGPGVGHVKKGGKNRKFPSIDIFVDGPSDMSDQEQDRLLKERGYPRGGAWYCYKCIPRDTPKPK